MSAPIETMTAVEAMAGKGIALEVVKVTKGDAPKVGSVEVPVEVPKSVRKPKSRPTPTREGPKSKKDKQKAKQSVRASLRKHPQTGKPTTSEKGKAIDVEPEVEVEELHVDTNDIDMDGVENVDVEGSDPISKLPEYIHSHRGKMKVLKDIDESKVTLHTPLLPDQIVFEGPRLGHIPLLKLEDLDLDDAKCFPHLAMDQLMHRVFYKDSGVTTLDPRKWVKGVDKVGLLNMLQVPHYNRTPITMVVIKQLLCLLHDGCLWLEDSIPITDILIHRITQLPHSGENSAISFGGKTGERNLAKAMKDKFKHAKKPHSYAITSIVDLAVKVATQILAGNIMRKCHAYEVLAPVVALEA